MASDSFPVRGFILFFVAGPPHPCPAPPPVGSSSEHSAAPLHPAFSTSPPEPHKFPRLLGHRDPSQPGENPQQPGKDKAPDTPGSFPPVSPATPDAGQRSSFHPFAWLDVPDPFPGVESGPSLCHFHPRLVSSSNRSSLAWLPPPPLKGIL